MNRLEAKKRIEQFLLEDVGSGDLSTDLVFGNELTGSGTFLAKEDGIVCGLDMIGLTYEAYGDSTVEITLYKKDGERVHAGEKLADVRGRVATLLPCERIALNLMQLMSGVATCTDSYVKTLGDDSIRICDTRKTYPGLRIFEKYAVTCGGGYNHRYALYDGVMLKDNHIAFAGGIEKAVKLVKSRLGHMVKIEVETETEQQVKEAVKAGVDVIMFDNRSPEEIKNLRQLVPSHIITEASGGIRLDNIAGYRGCGVDYISVGALTNGVRPLDISFNSREAIKV